MRPILALCATALCATALAVSGCQHSTANGTSIQIEAENGFRNIGAHSFQEENADFYSNGTVIMLSGSTPVGGSGAVEYDLAGIVRPGTYSFTLHYYDENDGHSPVRLTVGDQSFEFVMNAATPSAFQAIENRRATTFDNVIVKTGSVLRIEGVVDRYNSEHKELVRLDYFVFAPARSAPRSSD